MESWRSFVAVLPLLENLTIHPASSRFSVGMEKFTEEYMKTLEASFLHGDSKLGVRQDNASTSFDDSESLRILTTSEQTPQNATFEPHPQELEPPPNKQRVCFQKLSDAELQVLAKPMVLKST